MHPMDLATWIEQDEMDAQDARFAAMHAERTG